MTLTACPGCGGRFPDVDGPTHAYMTSSPGCWGRFGQVLAREYSTLELWPTHRLSVDAYAVQHPGGHDRRAIQSVGLHLARLLIQLEDATPPRETNDVMLGLSRNKASLPRLTPPASFPFTVADVPTEGPPEAHVAAVRAWAQAAWSAWSDQHGFIRAWTADALRR